MNETHPPLGGSATAIPPAGRYRIDPARSTITITTRHLFGLGPVRATSTALEREGESDAA